MTQTAVKTHASAKFIVTTLTFVAGIGIAAAFVQVTHEMEPRPTNSVARQFIELEKSAMSTTTDTSLGSP